MTDWAKIVGREQRVRKPCREYPGSCVMDPAKSVEFIVLKKPGERAIVQSDKNQRDSGSHRTWDEPGRTHTLLRHWLRNVLRWFDHV